MAAAGTTCNQRIERIEGTQHAKILRVPFRSKAGILRKWISRRALPHLQGRNVGVINSHCPRAP